MRKLSLLNPVAKKCEGVVVHEDKVSSGCDDVVERIAAVGGGRYVFRVQNFVLEKNGVVSTHPNIS